MGQSKSGTSSTSPSPQGIAALNAVLPQVQQYLNPATNPYVPVIQGTAQQNPEQLAAAENYNTAFGPANTGLGTYEQAQSLAQGAAQPLSQAEIDQYFNPYVNQVVDAAQRRFALQNAQQQNQVVGNETAQGALGGNRTAVAGALTAGEQAAAQDPIIAGMLQAGYTQQEAMAAQQFQQIPLAAASALQQIGAGQESAAGNIANLSLGQYGLGTQQQEYYTPGTPTTAILDRYYAEQLAKYGYPVQLTNMAAGDIGSLAGAYGSNTTTTPPPPSLVSGLAGAGTFGLGLAALAPMVSTGGRVQGRRTGGAVLPESPKTLHAQQRQLLEGHRRVQMFPHGSKELSLPSGMRRVEAHSGVFHYNPDKVSEAEIHKHAKAGTEHHLLDLGPYSKQEIMHRVRGGEAPVAVVERHPDGTEVRAAVGTRATAAEQAAHMERTKSPGHRIHVEDVRHTLAKRAVGGGVQGLLTGGVPAMPYGASPMSGLGPMPYAGGGSYIPQVGPINIPRLPTAAPMATPEDDSSKMFMDALKMSNLGTKDTSPEGIAAQDQSADRWQDFRMDTLGISQASGGRVPRAYGGLAMPSSNRINVPMRGGFGMPSFMARGGLAEGGDPEVMGEAVPPIIAQGPTPRTGPTLQDKMDDIESDYNLPDGYLSKTARIESSMNPNAHNELSGADGLFQFIPSTARQYGLSNTRDPMASADAAARLGRDNQAELTQALGRAPTAGELYLAHQQGAAGAIRLLTNPNAPAGSVVPAANIAANGGNPNAPASQFVAKWAGRLDNEDGDTQALALAPEDRQAGLQTPPPDTRGIPGVTPIKAPDISGKAKPDKTDIALSLMAAGLGMMGSRSPYAGVGIGQGGLQGIGTYEALHKQRVGEAEHQATLEQQANITNAHLAMQKAQQAIEDRRAAEVERHNRMGEREKPPIAGWGASQTGERVPGAYAFNPDSGKYEFTPGMELGKMPTNAKSAADMQFIEEYRAGHGGQYPTSTVLNDHQNEVANLKGLDTAIVSETNHYPDLKGKAGTLHIDKANVPKVISAFDSGKHLENIYDYAKKYPGAVGLLAKASNNLNLDAYKGLLAGDASVQGRADMEKALDKVAGGNVDDLAAAKVMNKLLITQAFNDASASGQRGGVYLDKVFRDLYQQASSKEAFLGILGARYEDANSRLEPYGLGFDKRDDKEKLPFWERLHGRGSSSGEGGTTAPQRKYSGGKYYIRGPNGEAVLDPNQSP